MANDNVVHVDFRRRIVVEPDDELTEPEKLFAAFAAFAARIVAADAEQDARDAAARAAAQAAEVGATARVPFVGSRFEETKHLTCADLAEFLRAYLRENFSRVEFRITSGRDTLEVVLTDFGRMPVYADAAKTRYSTEVGIITRDVEDFMRSCNRELPGGPSGQPSMRFHGSVRVCVP